MSQWLRYIHLEVENKIRSEEGISCEVVNLAAVAWLLQMSRTLSKPNFQLGNQKNSQISSLSKKHWHSVAVSMAGEQKRPPKTVTVFGLFRNRTPTKTLDAHLVTHTHKKEAVFPLHSKHIAVNVSKRL